MTLRSTNPATGELVAEYDEATSGEVEACLAQASTAFERWRHVEPAARASLLRALAARLRESVDELAQLATLEMGKILPESRGEVVKSAWFCEYAAEFGPAALAPRPIPGGHSENYVVREPVGPLLALMPWNFPYVQVFRFAPAALMAGNVVILKHASNVPQCALRIAELFTEAGFPQGVFQTLLAEPDVVEPLLADPRLKGLTLTGSDQVGSQVAALAGRQLKHAVLELGGSDAFVVLDDADIALAARVGCRARNINVGQACIAAKRFIVVDSVADRFESELTERVRALRVGDPRDPATDVGPMVNERARERLRGQVEDSVAKGAVLRVGGFDWDGPGSYVRPMVLTDVTPDMRVFHEETFGPVAPLLRVRDESEAIAAANASAFGLGATVMSSDVERARSVADRLEAGMVFVNTLVASDARLPFGGQKRSGLGRELGEWGFLEFTNLKSVAIA
ncbi:NAD-dependent succinate-semialdehyde dehydrogenase [Pseudonocardia kujensis]|uniref:NAD-dependent succinate-semialdehyde dehydrogenase n=1 Tax=Pseudonocardia kujensis TaxID=1128675 RepID=UPI001E33E19E|nr:NAD-dependent succinate-semialdehyde dehydrogenase [Pseudonocardia kujensis]MCE0764072.1 NAD-dependent succinate-semialdehyde dehydrogenase [Pseudonocardia kujensis]